MYKTVRELSREQLTELKERHLCEEMEEALNQTPSYGELADVDETISDEEIFEYYADTEFVDDDFFCSCEN